MLIPQRPLFLPDAFPCTVVVPQITCPIGTTCVAGNCIAAIPSITFPPGERTEYFFSSYIHDSFLSYGDSPGTTTYPMPWESGAQSIGDTLRILQSEESSTPAYSFATATSGNLIAGFPSFRMVTQQDVDPPSVDLTEGE